MKTRGRHPSNALTAVRVRALKEPGRYADGSGLYLVVDPTGNKRWMLRTTVRGKRCDIGLGGYSLVSLAEAREAATTLRKIARASGDPLAERRKSKKVIPTFEEAAKTVHGEHAKTWKNDRHFNQWINSLSVYAFPILGGQRVDHIGTPDVLKVLAPIWLTKPETARRVRQRIGVIIDWATAKGFRSGENPVDSVGQGLPKQPHTKSHHAALSYGEVPGFLQRLQSAELEDCTRWAFEFLILTAARTKEVVEAQWAEVDFETKTWTVPPERMKASRVHTVPLSDRCLEILRSAHKFSGTSRYVFPGKKAGKPLSNMAFLMTLRRMEVKATAHGFRSSFRDWASERTNFSRDVCEMALAHAVRDKTEAAYRRGDLLEKRRSLMNAWAAFTTSSNAKVIPLNAGSKKIGGV